MPKYKNKISIRLLTANEKSTEDQKKNDKTCSVKVKFYVNLAISGAWIQQFLSIF